MDNKLKNINFTQLFKKKNALFLIGLTGIFLLFIADLFAGANSLNNTQTEQIGQTNEVSSITIANEYTKELEMRLNEIISQVEGAGKTQIMLTLETPFENIYAKDMNNQSQTTINEDGTTNTHTIYESEHIIINSENNDTPIIEMQLLPEIKGVAVICEGGDDIVVISRITELVSVVLGVPTNRICVTKINLLEE